jgi:hypothetical protein
MLYQRRKLISQIRKTQMSLDAVQVEALQNSVPTDWTKFDQTVGADARRFGGMGLGGLPPGMGPGYDDKLHVRFFMKPRIDPIASARENRPIFKDVPFVEIMIPGDKNNIVTAEVWQQHITRFPQHWDQFQAGIKDQVVGTPLKLAPFLTESHVEELAYFKIRTIEQLADLSDTNMTFMGAREMQQAAKKYLLKVSGNDALMARIQALEDQNRILQAERTGAKDAGAAGLVEDEDTIAKRGGVVTGRNNLARR